LHPLEFFYTTKAVVKTLIKIKGKLRKPLPKLENLIGSKCTIRGMREKKK
jgi:hypothetical protein